MSILSYSFPIFIAISLAAYVVASIIAHRQRLRFEANQQEVLDAAANAIVEKAESLVQEQGQKNGDDEFFEEAKREASAGPQSLKVKVPVDNPNKKPWPEYYAGIQHEQALNGAAAGERLLHQQLADFMNACLVCDKDGDHNHTPTEINAFVKRAAAALASVAKGADVPDRAQLISEVVDLKKLDPETAEKLLDKYVPVKDPTGGEYVRDPYWFQYQQLKLQRELQLAEMAQSQIAPTKKRRKK